MEAVPFDQDVLLIYPLGNNDLKRDGADVPKTDFRDIVDNWLPLATSPKARVELIPAPNGGLPLGIHLSGGGRGERFHFPIFRDVLTYLLSEQPGCRLDIRFIATKQGDREKGKQDTYGLPPLLRRYLEALAATERRLPGFVTEQWIVEQNPADYDLMTTEFTAIARAYGPAVAAADHAYYSIAPGTPAMAFASAVTFGHETRLRFLYKPQWEDKPTQISRFLHLPRQRSLDLLDRTLAALDFGIAAGLLTQPGSGFRPDDAEIAEAVGLLALLPAWQRELFADATAEAIPESQGTLVRTLSETFVAPPAQDDPRNVLPFWHLRLIDCAVRLRIALIREDIAAFVDGLAHFIDLALLFGLAWDNPTIDWQNPRGHRPPEFWEEANRQGWSADSDRFSRSRKLNYLASRFGLPDVTDRAAKNSWLDALRRLNRLVDQKLRSYRDEHQHGAAAFERTLVDDFVREESGAHVQPSDGGWAVLAFVEDVLEAVPGMETLPNPDQFFQESLTIPREIAMQHDIEIPGACDELLHRIVPPPRPYAYQALRQPK